MQDNQQANEDKAATLASMDRFAINTLNISLLHGVWKSQKKSHSIFEWTKVNYKCQKLSILARFWKSEACGQTALPDSSLLI